MLYLYASPFFWLGIVLHDQTYVPDHDETVGRARDHLCRLRDERRLGQVGFLIVFLVVKVEVSHRLVPRPEKYHSNSLNIRNYLKSEPFTSGHKLSTAVLTKSNVGLDEIRVIGVLFFQIEIHRVEGLCVLLPYPHRDVLSLVLLILIKL